MKLVVMDVVEQHLYVKLYLIEKNLKNMIDLQNVKKIYYTSPFGFFIIIM